MLKIDTHLQIGEHHLNHCEDYLLTAEIGRYIHLIAVCDGCTMGKESWFASALIGKLLKKISREIHFRTLREPQLTEDLRALEKMILQKLFSEIKEIQQRLFLEKEELLSTLILGLIDLEKRRVKVTVIGDGLVKIDEDIYDFDQDNKPDYLGLHLSEDFEEWYLNQSQVIDNQFDKAIVISTDGLFSFLPYEYRNLRKTINSEELILKEAKLSLKQKMIYLEEEFGLKPTDDLAIISCQMLRQTKSQCPQSPFQ